MNIPENLRYTKEHEWIKVENDSAIVGISDYAQNELGDIVFVELPKTGDAVESMKPFGSIEAVKSVSDIFAPVSGVIIEVNQELESSPQLINQDPYGKGWIVKLKISNPQELDQLLSPGDYQSLVS
jgi:glycine cleavage system H protein